MGLTGSNGEAMMYATWRPTTASRTADRVFGVTMSKQEWNLDGKSCSSGFVKPTHSTPQL
jgi:hypothetical protein